MFGTGVSRKEAQNSESLLSKAEDQPCARSFRNIWRVDRAGAVFRPFGGPVIDAFETF